MWLSLLLLFLLCLFFASPFVALWAYNFARLKRMPLGALRDAVCAIPNDYFEYIGKDNPAVCEFNTLVTLHKYEELYSAWPRLQQSFRCAELERGHRGRPLILDYFCSYRSFVRELIHRGG